MEGCGLDGADGKVGIGPGRKERRDAGIILGAFDAFGERQGLTMARTS